MKTARMTQLEQILSDDSERGELSPEQFMARWKPLLESLDRMFEDPQQQVADNEVSAQGLKP